MFDHVGVGFRDPARSGRLDGPLLEPLYRGFVLDFDGNPAEAGLHA
jgi:hypothetical protein